jgi:hypothetical protein
MAELITTLNHKVGTGGRFTDLAGIGSDWWWNQGAELVTNPSFVTWTSADRPDGWTEVDDGDASSHVEEDGGKLKITTDGNATTGICYLYQAVGTMGKDYLVRCVVATDTSGTSLLSMGNTTLGTRTAVTGSAWDMATATTYIQYATPKSANPFVQIVAGVGDAANVHVITLCSVKELDPAIDPNGLPCNSIQFHAAADNDILIVRDGSLTGPVIFKSKAMIIDDSIKHFYGQRIRPVIDFSECTLNAASRVLFTWTEH